MYLNVFDHTKNGRKEAIHHFVSRNIVPQRKSTFNESFLPENKHDTVKTKGLRGGKKI